MIYAQDKNYRSNYYMFNLTVNHSLPPNEPPDACFSYSPLNPTVDDIINFMDLSVDNDGNITEWFWDFGDGNVSYDQNPIYQYNEIGNYSVCLTVTDSYYDYDVYCLPIVISSIDE